MSDHAKKEWAEGAARRRWKYLLSRVSWNMIGGNGIVLVLGFGCLTIACVYAVFDSWSYFPYSTGAWLLLAGVAAFFTFIGVCNIREAKKLADRTPYVPPVREQIAALPANEVLVRGSERPEATSDE